MSVQASMVPGCQRSARNAVLRPHTIDCLYLRFEAFFGIRGCFIAGHCNDCGRLLDHDCQRLVSINGANDGLVAVVSKSL